MATPVNEFPKSDQKDLKGRKENMKIPFTNAS